MKSFIAYTVLAVAIGAVVQAGPIAVSGNNVGDIVTVGVNVDADVDTKIDSNIVNVLVAIMSKMGDVQLSEEALEKIINGGGQAPEGKTTELGHGGNILEELMGHFKQHPEQLKQLLSGESAKKMIEQLKL